MLKFILIYEPILYCCCIFSIIRNIFEINFQSRKRICLSILSCSLFALTIFFEDDNILYFLYGISHLLILFSVKILFKKVKFRAVISIYMVLYSTNIILIAFTILLISSITSSFEVIDIIINTVTATFCIVACHTDIKYKIQQIVEWTPKSTKRLSLFMMIAGALVSSYMTEGSYFTYKYVWDIVLKISLGLFLTAICLVLPFLILNSISNKQLKRLTENYERQIKAQAEHYKNLAKSNYELRRFKHDFKNISIAIEKMLADGQNLQVLKMVKDCNDSLDGHGNPLLKFDTGNGIADALLTEKQMRADEVNAEIAFDGAITQDYLSPTDLCVILGNTLDNAIEACENLPIENRKTITVVSNCNSGFMFLSISNPIHEKVKINKNHISTTKENKTLHGFGLYSLNSVVKNYDGSVELNSTDDNFTINIDLCLVGTQKTIA